ncbi:MAG TPA: beta-ketoacyl-[acyl-carrier-protein] synthase family protein [Candidatus Methylacidiphilales bacterium]|nr:beta-ketoacyl-[acyl-carrier-protein] synthase family protein [Candidatus Methylacidiphilales bacterium]
MSSPRVVITGIGALTCIGHGRKGLWEGILRERSGIGFVSRFNTSEYDAKCAGEINDFQPEEHFPPHKLKRIDRYAQFSLVITRQALDDAELKLLPENPRTDAGVSFGTALGGITTAELHHEHFLYDGIRAVPASLALQVFGGSAHSNIAIAYGVRGYCTTNSNSCASGTVAIGEAYRVIREGKVQIMIAGAAEAPLASLTFGAFDTIKSMAKESKDSTQACRPFDSKRTGFIMAEGGGCVVLESLEHARARGAHIYAEVLGYTLNNDAYHMSSSLPEGESAIESMRSALEEAKVRPDQIDYINAHASSTPMNDGIEARAVTKFFGSKTPAISGTKAYYGHPLGASGAIEAAICCLAMENSYIPPTLNCDEPCPEITPGFDLVRLKGRSQRIKYALSNSFGFGGINASLVFGKAE